MWPFFIVNKNLGPFFFNVLHNTSSFGCLSHCLRVYFQQQKEVVECTIKLLVEWIWQKERWLGENRASVNGVFVTCGWCVGVEGGGGDIF